jgi:hypothetical protein
MTCKQFVFRFGKFPSKDVPSIHASGSIRGMKKLGFWNKRDVIVKMGDYYYNQGTNP